ncbi:biotin--[acetyl-CoA-carboxylase] ligase [Elstera litoralis]|uniref:biotin--[acetyl-CoA-carboxylase] ligase n=1 Tax=Elstera litoralis TaxID=552518 RepID=UPI0012ED1FCB|nr:biotin--[acetyl-CoA-carboxylase] ligase [Elstera litoralis]
MTLPPGWRLQDFESVASTMELATQALVEGAGEGLVIRAREQVSGRGRQGRVWRSPVGNLYMSILIDPAPTLAETAQLSFVAGLAVWRAVSDLAPGAALQLKWPNDLLLDGAKLAGLLLEVPYAGRPAVLGLGINLRTAPTDTPYSATCLPPRATGPVDRDEATEAVTLRLAETLGQWRREGFDSIRRDWQSVAHPIGTPLTVRLTPETPIQGSFDGLGPDGHLRLKTAEGVRQIPAGDVILA